MACAHHVSSLYASETYYFCGANWNSPKLTRIQINCPNTRGDLAVVDQKREESNATVAVLTARERMAFNGQ